MAKVKKPFLTVGCELEKLSPTKAEVHLYLMDEDRKRADTILHCTMLNTLPGEEPPAIARQAFNLFLRDGDYSPFDAAKMGKLVVQAHREDQDKIKPRHRTNYDGRHQIDLEVYEYD